jgi:hypothetical protein
VVRFLFWPTRPSSLIPRVWFAHIPVAGARLSMYEEIFRKREANQLDVPISVARFLHCGSASFAAGVLSHFAAYVIGNPVLVIASRFQSSSVVAVPPAALSWRLLWKGPNLSALLFSSSVWGVSMAIYEMLRLYSGIPSSGESTWYR